MADTDFLSVPLLPPDTGVTDALDDLAGRKSALVAFTQEGALHVLRASDLYRRVRQTTVPVTLAGIRTTVQATPVIVFEGVPDDLSGAQWRDLADAMQAANKQVALFRKTKGGAATVAALTVDGVVLRAAAARVTKALGSGGVYQCQECDDEPFLPTASCPRNHLHKPVRVGG